MMTPVKKRGKNREALEDGSLKLFTCHVLSEIVCASQALPIGNQPHRAGCKTLFL